MNIYTLLHKRLFLILGFSCSLFLSQASTTVNLKVFIEGYYIGNSNMRPARQNSGCPNSNNISALIQVKLLDPISFSVVDATQAELTIMGTCTAIFAGNYSGSYYICIEHCNAGARTALPVPLSGIATYDFSTSPSQAFAAELIEMESGTGIYGIPSLNADYDQDGNIDIFDFLYLLNFPPLACGDCADINGDGFPGNIADLIIFRRNTLLPVFQPCNKSFLLFKQHKFLTYKLNKHEKFLKQKKQNPIVTHDVLMGSQIKRCTKLSIDDYRKSNFNFY